MPVFDNLTPYFVAMLAPDRPSLEHQWALCVWDDLIDYAPGELSSLCLLSHFSRRKCWLGIWRRFWSCCRFLNSLHGTYRTIFNHADARFTAFLILTMSTFLLIFNESQLSLAISAIEIQLVNLCCLFKISSIPSNAMTYSRHWGGVDGLAGRWSEGSGHQITWTSPQVQFQSTSSTSYSLS